MATPITWKTIAAPDMGSELRAVQASGDALGDAIAGFGTSVQDVAGIAQKSETDEFIAALNAANTDDERTAMVEAADKAWLNMERVNTAVTDAELQDFRVAQEARAETESKDKHDAAVSKEAFDKLMRPKKLTEIDQRITREEAEQPLDAQIKGTKVKKEDLEYEQAVLKAPYEIEKLEYQVENQELQNEKIVAEMANNENVSQMAQQKHNEWMENHLNREKIILQNIKNAELQWEKDDWELKTNKDLAPEKKLELNNRLKLSAKRLKLAEMELKEEERKITNQGLVAQQLNKAMLAEGTQAQATALLDAINENKGAAQPIDDALLKTEYSRIVNNDRSIELGYGKQGMDSATFKLGITDGEGNPTFGDKSFTGNNQQRLRDHLFKQVKERYKGASATEIEAHVDRMMRQSPHALQFANQAALEAKGEDAQRKVEHNKLVSGLMNKLDGMDIVKDPNGYRKALNDGISELRNLEKPVSNEILKRLGWHQEQALETSYFDGPKSAEALYQSSLKLSKEKGPDGQPVYIKDFSAGNKTRLINTIDRMILQENRFASKKARVEKRNLMLQNTPGLLTGYQAEARKVARGMEITKLSGDSAIDIIKNRLDITVKMTTGEKGSAGVQNYLGEELKKKFKADGSWEDVNVRELGKSIYKTDAKLNSIFGQGSLSTGALNAFKLAKHGLLMSTNVDWDAGFLGAGGTRVNEYELSGVPGAEESDMSQLDNWQYIAGILQNLPTDASGQAGFTNKHTAIIEKMALNKLDKLGYGLDVSDGEVKLKSLIEARNHFGGKKGSNKTSDKEEKTATTKAADSKEPPDRGDYATVEAFKKATLAWQNAQFGNR